MEELPVTDVRFLSITDFPDKLCTSLTVVGCNFRCPFCPNKDLIFNIEKLDKIPNKDLVNSLYPRIGFIDGVCLMGGEPTLHRELVDFLVNLREIRSLIKINTNGTRPKTIQILLDKKLVDYFTFNLIGPLNRYKEITRTNIDIKVIKDSIQLIRKSGLDYEFKLVVVPTIHSKEDIINIAQNLAGSRKLVIEQFDPTKTLELEFQKIKPYSTQELEEFKKCALPYFAETVIKY